MNEYYGYQQNDYRSYLMHYGKGQKAKNHKYIDIVNGRYIYPEDKGSRSKIDTTKSQKKVNSGYHVRAKQINAYLAKENGDNSVWVAGKSVGAKKESSFAKAARKSNKLKSNSLNEIMSGLSKKTKDDMRESIKNKKTSPNKTAKRRIKSVPTFYGWKNDNGGDWDMFTGKYGYGKLRSQGKYASRKSR